MKTLPLLAAVAGLVLASAPASYAAAHTAPRDSASVTLPKPLQVVKPTKIPHRFVDATIELRMTITSDGRAVGVSGVGELPKDLAKRLIPAVEQWTFSPPLRDGQPTAMEVIIPLKLVDRSV